MRYKTNPITKKDLTITSRSMRFSWGLFAYEALLTVVFLIAMKVLSASSGRYYATSNATSYATFVSLFPVVAVAEICMVALIIPIMTGGSVSGEKERQTFDIMLTTQIRPMQIVIGKMFTAIVRVMIYVVASVPIMAVGFTIGGISWLALLFFLLLTFVLAILEASIGVFCSATCQKSITAIILSYLFMIVLYALTFVPLLIAAIYDAAIGGYSRVTEKAMVTFSTILLLPNPIMTFLEFFGFSLTGDALVVKELTDECLGAVSFLGNSVVWISISVVLMLLISFVFMKLAAWAIDPLRGARRKDKK